MLYLVFVELASLPSALTEDAERLQQAASLDCDAAFVATVPFEVYENDSYLASDSSPCSDHHRTVHAAPAGSNRKLVVL